MVVSCSKWHSKVLRFCFFAAISGLPYGLHAPLVGHFCALPMGEPRCGGAEVSDSGLSDPQSDWIGFSSHPLFAPTYPRLTPSLFSGSLSWAYGFLSNDTLDAPLWWVSHWQGRQNAIWMSAPWCAQNWNAFSRLSCHKAMMRSYLFGSGCRYLGLLGFHLICYWLWVELHRVKQWIFPMSAQWRAYLQTTTDEMYECPIETSVMEVWICTQG